MKSNVEDFMEKRKKNKMQVQRNIPSNTITQIHKIPTFIIYLAVSVVGTKVTFLQGVYGLIK